MEGVAIKRRDDVIPSIRTMSAVTPFSEDASPTFNAAAAVGAFIKDAALSTES